MVHKYRQEGNEPPRYRLPRPLLNPRKQAPDMPSYYK